MTNLDNSRRQWEQEIRDAQGGLEKYGNFQRGMRKGYIFYRKWAGRPLIPDAKHGLRFIAGVVIAFGGVLVAGATIERVLLRQAASVALLVVGLVIACSAFDLR